LREARSVLVFITHKDSLIDFVNNAFV
jgi:hypothetical protein